MDALTQRFPKALIQFEDFKTPHAEFFLNRYRNKCRIFNDDIQGTGTMVLAGILCALRAQKKLSKDITQQRIVCLGAGSAGLGVCNSLLQVRAACVCHD
jgi:malic enzyme